MTDDKERKIYQCVHCGHPVSELYKDFKKGIIKISHCAKCNEVADKYIEYDSVIIFLDVLLLQRPAYRHILVNAQCKSYWRLLLVLWLCDALTKLMQRKAGVSSPRLPPDNVFYSALELDFYQDYLFSAAESVVFFCAVVGLVAAWHGVRHRTLGHFDLRSVVLAIVLSSMGRLLVVPALIWGASYSALGVALTHLFVAASNVQALKVVNKSCGLWIVGVVVLVSYAAQAAFSSLFPHRSSSLSVFYNFHFNHTHWLHVSS